MNNDKLVKKYKYNKVKKVILIILPFMVIILEILALFKVIDIIWGIIVFLIMYVLKKTTEKKV